MIDYLPLKKITAQHGEEIQQAVGDVVKSGWYLRGEATARFEKNFTRFVGTRHCIGVANGLDALMLITRAYLYKGLLHKGDEVIVPANTFIASILALTHVGLKPVLVEPDINTLQIDDRLIEQAITSKTRALMLVHLYGQCAFTEKIEDICIRHNLLLIEDCAQAHGCQWHPGPLVGSLGHAAAFSFYPGKNLGALGDGGAVTTNDDEVATIVRSLGNYGSTRKYVFDYLGQNSRLDDIQAAVLDVKLKYLDADNQRRRDIARRYRKEIHHPDIVIPGGQEDHVYHIFPVLCSRRDELQQHLHVQGIGTLIHYPIPPHKQICYPEWNDLSLPITERISREELSLPCNQTLTDSEVEQVINAVNSISLKDSSCLMSR